MNTSFFDNIFQNFDKREWIVPMMDILMFIRILTVYPLLTYFIRVQNFSVFMNTEWPGYPKVAMVNFFLVALGCSCAMFYDKVSRFCLFFSKNVFELKILCRNILLSNFVLNTEQHDLKCHKKWASPNLFFQEKVNSYEPVGLSLQIG